MKIIVRSSGTAFSTVETMIVVEISVVKHITNIAEIFGEYSVAVFTPKQIIIDFNVTKETKSVIVD